MMRQAQRIQKQHGSALIISLSILLVLTVLGISSMSTTALQERMAGNTRDSEIAFEAAESGLRAGENYIEALNNSSLPGFDGSAGLWNKPTTAQDYAWQTETNWDTAVKDTSFPMNKGSSFPIKVAKDPRYIIQLLDTTTGSSTSEQALESTSYTNNPPTIAGKVKVFQITARGYGLSATSRVMLQSYYGKVF